MSSKKKGNVFKTLAFRLTLLYTGLFILSTLVAFISIYLLMSRVLIERMDETLVTEIGEFLVLHENENLEALQAELSLEAQNYGVQKVFFRLFDKNGQVLFTTDLEAWRGLEAGSVYAQRYQLEGEPLFNTIELAHGRHKARTVVAPLTDSILIQFGESLRESEEYLAAFVGVFARIMCLVIIIASISGWLMARRAMGGVEEVTRIALSISKGDFAERVPIQSRGSEIERLASAFNYMADRVQALLNGIREVTDNIAHDLRSPITSIRGTAETTLMNGTDLDDFRSMAGNTVEECDRLLSMVNAMLDISEAEAGASKMELGEIDLVRVVEQACDLFLPIAEEREILLNVHAGSPCILRGDLKKIQRLISNLLDNALKYTRAKGTVVVDVSSSAEKVVIRVEDTGVGIGEDDLPCIFQRFYRCDESRTQEGSGLGLSLAQAIVTAHEGHIDVTSTLGSGTRFVVTLPTNLPE